MNETVKMILEILLCFLAVVGLVYLLCDIFDYLYYRKRKYSSPVIIDAKNMSRPEFVEVLKLYDSITDKRKSRALIGKVFVIIDENSKLSKENIKELMNIFGVEGSVGNKESVVRFIDRS